MTAQTNTQQIPHAQPPGDRQLEILEQLIKLTARFDSMDDSLELLRHGVDQRFSHLESKLTKISDILTGHDGASGLIIRTDRLEQNATRYEKRLDRAYAASLTALLSLIVGILLFWIKVYTK